MKRIYVLVLILLITVGSVGCSAANSGNSVNKNMGSLTIGVLPDVDSIPLIIAEHKGYFKEEGIDVKIEHFKSALDRDTALQTGNIDGAVSDMLAAVFLNDNGFNVKITSKTDGSYKLISGRSSNIDSINQTEGKSIGISKNTIIEYLTDRILKDFKISINKVNKVAVPKIPTRLEMLNNGKLDMATLPEPLASVAIAEGGLQLSSSNELNINPGVILFTDKAISAKSEEIKAFYRAYNKAVEYLQNEKLENFVEVLVNKAGFPEAIKDVLILPNYSKASLPPEKEFIEVLDWLKSKELTNSEYSFSQLTDSQFLK